MNMETIQESMKAIILFRIVEHTEKAEGFL